MSSAYNDTSDFLNPVIVLRILSYLRVHRDRDVGWGKFRAASGLPERNRNRKDARRYESELLKRGWIEKRQVGGRKPFGKTTFHYRITEAGDGWYDCHKRGIDDLRWTEKEEKGDWSVERRSRRIRGEDATKDDDYSGANPFARVP